MKPHVLVIDDDPCLCTVLETELSQRQYRVTVAASPDEALKDIAAGVDDIDAILTDFNMAGTSGVQVCARVVASGRDIPVIVMTAFGSLDSAVGCIRAGAYDYVTKPLDPDDLALTLERAVRERALREEVRWLGRIQTDQHFEGLGRHKP